MMRLLLCCGLSICVVCPALADDHVKPLKPKKRVSPAGAVQSVPPSGYYPSESPGRIAEAVVTQDHPVATVPSVELTPVPATGRKKWESLLNEPADLNFEDRQSVTVKEVLDALRERHHLSLRLDIPTLSALIGAENIIAEPRTGHRPKAATSSGKFVPHTAARHAQFPVRLTGGSGRTSVVENELNEEEDDDEDEDDDDRMVKPIDETASGNVDDKSQSEDEGECEGDDEEDQDKGKAEVSSDEVESAENIVAKFLKLEVDLQLLDLKQATVATVLRQTMDVIPIVFGSDFMEMPFPISLSNACLLDYLLENDGLVITTRMQALSHKETRVYSIKHLKDINAEQLAKIIRQSVRPWSWRSQINDLGDQLRGSVQIPQELVKSIVTTGIQLAAAETGATVTISDEEPPKLGTDAEKSDAEQLNAIGNATVNGVVTLAHATILGLEMVHHADFPTGTIMTLPGKLIVTQSQAAHREIADLLKQLSDE